MNELFERVDDNIPNILNKTGKSILVVDRKGEIVFANEEANKKIDGSKDGLVGNNIVSKLSHKKGKDRNKPNSSPVSRTISSGVKIEVNEDAFWRKKSSEIPVQYCSSPLMNEIGETIGAIISLERLTDHKKLEEKLRSLKSRDRLTGLINHIEFQKTLRRVINNSNKKDTSGAVMLLDIDRFKEINNSLGLKKADKLLKEVAALLKSQTNRSQTLARFGGDEFILLSTSSGENGAEKLASKILSAVRNHRFEIGGKGHQVTMSIGLSLFPDQGETTKELLANADIALSQAKKSGRNQYKIYDPDLDSREETESRVGWVKQIDDAIKQNNFVLYAQPILELGKEKISHYEILIRMLEGNNKVISPGKFLPVAEKFGLSREIDRWVINETLRRLNKTGNEYLEHQFAINLSGQSLTDDELLSWLKNGGSFDESNFEKILFEVTETAALNNIESANNFISALKSRGCQFALDDFGMGFSSFNYLRQLSVDYLKIDGSFIQNLPQDSMNQNLVQSIVEVAHKLHKETIAEFVEDEETLRMVRNYGSDHAQGYHIGKPSPLGNYI